MLKIIVILVAALAGIPQDALAQNADCKTQMAPLEARLITAINMSSPYRKKYIDSRTPENLAAFCGNNPLFAQEMRGILAGLDKLPNCKNLPDWKKFVSDTQGLLKDSNEIGGKLCKR